MVTQIIVPKLIDFPVNVDSGYAQIISAISHELRTPISILKLNIQLMKKIAANCDESNANESISMCEDSIESMMDFLDNFQFLSTAIKSELSPSHTVFSVEKILQEQFSELRRVNLQSSRICYSISLPADEIYFDQYFFQKLLHILLSNALKFSTEKVHLTIKGDYKSISMTVQDFGIGIPDDEIESIFKPFSRATNVRRIPGTGLGLSILHEIIRCVDGKIFVSGNLGEGTTIEIILPYGKSDTHSGNRR